MSPLSRSSGQNMLGGLPRRASSRRGLDDRHDPAYPAVVMNRAARFAISVVLAVTVLVFLSAGLGLHLSVGSLLLNLAVFLAFLALCTWVVATVWKAVMRR